MFDPGDLVCDPSEIIAFAFDQGVNGSVCGSQAVDGGRAWGYGEAVGLDVGW